jgi:heat shock protein HslJ
MPARMTVAAAIGLTVAGLAGCEPSLDLTRWRAVMVDGGSPLGHTALTIHLGPGQLTGFGGCNEFASSSLTMGSGSLAEGKPIAVGPITADDAVCDGPGVMQQERDFLEDLASVNLLRFEDDRLILTGPAVELQFEQEPFRR